jgi:hypothetical protein
MAELLKHKMEIATAIRRQIGAGVAMNGMYKTYRADIADARANLQEEMGSVVINAAKGGDWKAAELVLRSKAGWSPTQTVVEGEPEDEASDTGAIDDLLALLGKRKIEKEE